jgi:integrase
MIFSKEDVITFVVNAPDDTYLMIKVAIVFGISGACRLEELANISVDDIEDRNSVRVITIPKTKTNKKRVFTIINDNSISALEIYRKYALLRPKNMNHRRFFLQYKNNRCTVQPVGKNTFGTILQLC